MTNIKNILLSTALFAVVAVPAFAAEGKKTKEIKELVGYEVTETKAYTTKREKFFTKLDKNEDAQVSFKEFQRYAINDNNYEVFAMMDTDQSKGVSLDEYLNFNRTKGKTHVESELHGKSTVRGTNLKTRALPEVKSYYVPVEREIVEIKDISAE